MVDDYVLFLFFLAESSFSGSSLIGLEDLTFDRDRTHFPALPVCDVSLGLGKFLIFPLKLNKIAYDLLFN